MLDIMYIVRMGKEHTEPTQNEGMARAQLRSALSIWEMFGGARPYLDVIVGEVK